MEDIILTPQQEKEVLDFWNKFPNSPPGIKELTKHIFPDGDYDGRSAQGRAVKGVLSKLNLRAKATSDFVSKTSAIILTDEQKAFITNNVGTMNCLELTRTLFNNETLTTLNAETRVVYEFVKTLDTRVIYNSKSNESIPEGEYQPPNTLDKVLRLVNKYVNFTIDKDKITSRDKAGLEMLINYLHTYRFIRQMNTFDTQEDRNSCEDAFIRCTYDKSDLTQEEVDQYIEYANATVQGVQCSRRKELLNRSLEDLTRSNLDNPEMQQRARMDLVESIGKISTEYDQCMKRQNKLLEDLKVKRSTRLDKQVKENASILNLVTDWRDEEMRLKYIKIGQLEQQTIAAEIEKIMSMSEIRARILGLNIDTILKG